MLVATRVTRAEKALIEALAIDRGVSVATLLRGMIVPAVTEALQMSTGGRSPVRHTGTAQ